MLTRTTPKNNTGKKEDPREQLKGLPGLTAEFLEGFMDGLEFGAFEEKYHIKWKHGSPWKYPAHQYPMLKTAIRAFMVAEETTLEKARTAKTDMVKALGISEEAKEKNKTAAKSMAAYFKDLPK